MISPTVTYFALLFCLPTLSYSLLSTHVVRLPTRHRASLSIWLGMPPAITTYLSNYLPVLIYIPTYHVRARKNSFAEAQARQARRG
ncbi:hypothetical protein GGR56DRAFT_622230 [Xylariaceae sp. FL0804]|nr:hypothetical protein GGR56DRAFT_622230 [Xylariaceae sp. FL0804]